MPRRFKLMGALGLALLLAGVGPWAGQAFAKAGVAGKVGTRTFTLEEVDAKALSANIKPYQDLYEVRKAALQELVADYLLDTQAKKLGISKDELVKREITDKIKPVTDADVEAWFNANKARVGNRTLEQVAEQIKAFLTSQGTQSAEAAYLDTLKKDAQVHVLLDPPRLEVKLAKHSPTKGPANAPVTIVEFADYQ